MQESQVMTNDHNKSCEDEGGIVFVSRLQAEGFLPDDASCVGMEIIPDSASLLLAISNGLLLQVRLYSPSPNFAW